MWLKILLSILLSIPMWAFVIPKFCDLVDRMCDIIEGADDSAFYQGVIIPIVGLVISLLIPTIFLILAVLPWGAVDLLLESNL